jgi:hypothetical protein
MKHFHENIVTLLRKGALAVCVFFLSVTIGEGQAIPMDSLEQSKFQTGDLCVVCGLEIESIDLVFVYEGRRVAVHRDKVDSFLASPDKYFSSLQARGALFNEESVSQNQMQLGWFYFGIWVAFSLLTAAFSANLAVRKAFPPLRWFIIGFVFNVVGVLVIALKSPNAEVELPAHFAKLKTTAEPIDCPQCASPIHPIARQCPKCGFVLHPASNSEVERAGIN